MTLRNTDAVPIAKARRSVSEVMVIPIPALARALPRILGTLPMVCSRGSFGRFSLQADIIRNMSSTPMPVQPGKDGVRWRDLHVCYLLTRREQVTVFRLRTGLDRLSYHLYWRLRTGHTEQCPCGTGSQTTERLLQFCPLRESLREGIWPARIPVTGKLYDSLEDLRHTATFIGETGVSIERAEEEEEEEEMTVWMLTRSGLPICLRSLSLLVCAALK